MVPPCSVLVLLPTLETVLAVKQKELHVPDTFPQARCPGPRTAAMMPTPDTQATVSCPNHVLAGITCACGFGTHLFNNALQPPSNFQL